MVMHRYRVRPGITNHEALYPSIEVSVSWNPFSSRAYLTFREISYLIYDKLIIIRVAFNVDNIALSDLPRELNVATWYNFLLYHTTFCEEVETDEMRLLDKDGVEFAHVEFMSRRGLNIFRRILIPMKQTTSCVVNSEIADQFSNTPRFIQKIKQWIGHKHP